VPCRRRGTSWLLARALHSAIASGLIIPAFPAAPPVTGRSAIPKLVFERVDSARSTVYAARGAGFSVQLGRDGLKLRLDGAARSLEMWLAGAKSVVPEGQAPLPGSVNYYVGAESAWRRGVTAYGNVTYRQIYPGIDLVFHGRHAQLEYDFVVKPSFDPRKIELQWSGVDNISLDRDGALILASSGGQVRWEPPCVYQETDGVETRIDGEFRLLGSNRVGFHVGHYDHARPLVIDPVLAFSTYLGGGGAEIARGLAVDTSGNLFVSGLTNSKNLPVTRSAFQTGYGGATTAINTGDAFLAKYSPTGELIFLTYLGGQIDDAAMAVAVDAAGNAYVTGYTNSLDFPVTAGAVQARFAGMSGDGAINLGDAFVTKISADGHTLLYSTYLGGAQDDAAFGIAVDSSGNAYVTGTTLSGNFPVTAGAAQAQYAGSGRQKSFPRIMSSAIRAGDAFVAKLNPAGTTLVYSTLLGGRYDDLATSIALDTAGSAYIGGYTLSDNFPTTAGSFSRTYGGVEGANNFFNLGDGFLAKLNPAGSEWTYATYIGGSGDDWISALTLDEGRNVYATGSSTSINFPVTGSSPKYRGPNSVPFYVDQLIGDAFVLKLNAAGSALVYSTFLGGTGDDCGMAIVLDQKGNAIIAGASNSKDFPVTPDAMQKTIAGRAYSISRNTAGDGLIAVVNPSGVLAYATFLGGRDDDAWMSAAISASGTLYLGGLTTSANFPLLRAAQPTRAGNLIPAMDAVVAAISGISISGPQINAVLNATGEAATIAPNTWIEIKGQNLAASTRIWQGGDFVSGQMPTRLDGVNVTVNGKPVSCTTSAISK